eukprot:TRINITY_DN1652_c0_g1_i1.p3 TRINITY_DN1652_c0_g1~~TRINITY_DN1652_c0_g1_i1.p3  ORF type:complete len:125 (+),score=36.84 TRINITY_DN1652_c0_g1_i1:63-437(+)
MNLDGEAAPLDAFAIAIAAVWGALGLLSLATVASNRFAHMSVFTVPLGCISLLLFAVVSHEMAAWTQVPMLVTFSRAFDPSNLKATDVILSGLIMLVAFGFSKVTDEVNKVAVALSMGPQARRG